MTKPNYLVDVLWEGGVNCRGEQLKEILELIELYPQLKMQFGMHQISILLQYLNVLENLEILFLKKVGNTRDLIAICQHVDQFLSGVFFAFTKDVGDQLNEEFETEDESFRDIGDAVLEIRAFDTTYFRIYTNDYDLVHKIAEKFHSEIQLNTYHKEAL